MFVVIESPYAGDVSRNVRYARRAMLHAISLGEAPFASHLLYTQVLDDDDAFERKLGIDCGLEVGSHAEKTVVYTDLGITPGMRKGIERAESEGRPVEYRQIGEVDDDDSPVDTWTRKRPWLSTFLVGDDDG